MDDGLRAQRGGDIQAQLLLRHIKRQLQLLFKLLRFRARQQGWELPGPCVVQSHQRHFFVARSKRDDAATSANAAPRTTPILSAFVRSHG